MQNQHSDEFFQCILTNWSEKNDKRYQFIYSLSEAQNKLINFELKLTIRAKQPTYGIIRFTHSDITKYKKLNSFV